MPESRLHLESVPAAEITDSARNEIVALMDRAYGRPMLPFLADLSLHTHVIGRVDSVIVSHAAWVERHLQAGQGLLMHTAYVELVATDPAYQRRGYASEVMRLLADALIEYDVAALCPSDAGAKLYASLGWEIWRGPLFVRGTHELIPTPDEQVMVLRLPKSPSLDLEAFLSAEWRPGELW